jgi:uncharacterized membrane protein
MSLGQVQVPPSLNQSAGIVLVSCGLSLLALDKLQGLARWPLLLAAASAGAAVASYSVIDAYGTRLFGTWFAFTAWLVVLDSFAFLAVTRFPRGPALWAELNSARLRVIVSGLLGLLSFCVFLWALSRNSVSSVTRIQESSVLFAMAIGTLVHGETLSLRRSTGAFAVLIALIAIAL